MAEVVAGAFLSSMFQFLLERIDSLQLVQFFKGQKLDHALLKKLKITMITVNGLLDHAEEKQIFVPAVKEWLNELKDAVYEADDLLDEIAYEALQSKFKVGSSWSKQKVSSLFLSHHYKPVNKLEVNTKLEEILDLFEHLVKQMDALGLSMRKGIGQKPSSQKTPTTSMLDDEYGVRGRNEDKEIIIKSLQNDDCNGPGVISIAGMGGIGKTTLAQLVYNDYRIEELFDVKAWVYVSEEFDVSTIMKDILKEITTNSCNLEIPNGKNELGYVLKKKLKGKKFLLIMDDVWNDTYADWSILRSSLQNGAQGSKVVITTRTESISLMMHDQGILYRLNELSNDDCWSLFAEHAFGDGNSNNYSDLYRVGRKIVQKCKGLPLAAKTIGSLLRLKRDVDEWERVLNNNMWDLVSDNILPALTLSYHYLPSHLKQCFAYCAVFPKHYRFLKDELIRLWMAEGLLMPPKGSNKDMEHVGNEYFSDLVSRSFFQQSTGDVSCFVMHDLIHELANFISGEFCLRFHSSTIPSRTRHLSYGSEYGELDGINGYLLLRTFLYLGPGWMSDSLPFRNKYAPLLLLRCLRVLSLPRWSCKTKLPGSIGNLKHLRYLNLTGALIVKLPESVTCLYHLQTLILFQCQKLIELPTRSAMLINLRFLDIRETRLQKMPPRMGNLTELRMLTKFVMGTRKWSRSSIRELMNLDNLRGELSIENLQNVKSAKEASAACLERKKHLKKLVFEWAGEVDPEIANGVLKSLKPHENLECLSIIGYGGTEFPYWMDNGYSSVSNLVSLKLNGCKNCSCLPSLGDLPCLRDVSITAFEKVTNVDRLFYGRLKTLIPFKSIKILRFEKMSQWEQWSDVDGAFPLLQELYIKDCPKLIKSLPSCLPSLTTMVISGCHQLVVSLSRAPTLWKVRLNEVVLDKLSSGLYSLQVDEYFQVAVKQMEALSTVLEEIHIRNDSSLIYLPMVSFPNLKKLNVRQCSHLKSFFQAEAASASCSVIRDPSNSISYSDPKFPPIQHVHIIDCPELCVASLLMLPTIQSMKLISWGRTQMDLSKLSSGLFCLQVHHFDLFEKIQGQNLSGVFTNFEAIEISSCRTLKNFWLECFPKLKSLNIYQCSHLESLCAPETISLENREQSDTSSEVCSTFPLLQELCIYGCKKLHLLSLPRASTIRTMSLQDHTRDLRLHKQTSGLYSLHVRRFYSFDEIERWLMSGGFPYSTAEITIEVCDQLTYFQLGKFPKLQSLEIGHCPNFQSLETTDEEFTSLSSLSVRQCPNFSSFPRGGLRAPNLTFLSLLNCSSLNSLPDDMHSFLPSLVNLIIAGCPRFESFLEGCFPSTLSLLRLMDLQNLKFIEHKELIHLRELSIQDCPNLQSTPERILAPLPSLVSLRICNCPLLKSFVDGSLPFKLESLNIRNCDKFLASLVQCDLYTLQSLTHLTVAGNNDLASLSEETVLPSSLTYLCIQGFQKLKSLLLQHLTCLTMLKIHDCPELQSLSEERLPTSLSTLVIRDCPKLHFMPEEELPSSLSSLVISGCPLLKKNNICEWGSGGPDNDLSD